MTFHARRIDACRFCGGKLAISFCDLGATPLANSYVAPEKANEPDPVFPLHARVCERCFLVQLDHVVDAAEIFLDYAYFSSFSTSWLDHARRYAMTMIERLRLGANDFVVEVASNDGYLLKNFVASNIPCLGIEPAENVAAAARTAGVPTDAVFFGLATANDIVTRRGHASLIVANNVLAHVPDVNDFVAGLARLAGPAGTITIEAPHLLELVRHVEFDTIYHEHYSYWSLHAMSAVLKAHGLDVIDVEKLPTHGGSLRVFAHASGSTASPNVDAVRREEVAAGITKPQFYEQFGLRVRSVLNDFRAHLGIARASGRTVAGYGAAAKGNTFLNAGGMTANDILFVADRSPHKQGHLLPGSRIPVVAPQNVFERKPNDLVILAWNLADEIARDMAGIRQWGGRFVIAVPQLRIFGPSP